MTAVAPRNASPTSPAVPAKGAPKKACWGKIIPDTFYAIKEETKPIAGPGITIALTLLLYVLSIGVFTGLWIFYSDKGQWESKSFTQSEHSRAGFTCVPLQGMDLHGLKGTMMNYDDCLNTVEPVSAVNVVNQNDGGYVYTWTVGGVASYTSSTTESVSSSEWQKEGYVCRSAKKNPFYGTTMNYDECVASAKSYTDETYFRCAYIAGPPANSGGAGPNYEGPLESMLDWTYSPFGDDNYGFEFSEDSKDSKDHPCKVCVKESITQEFSVGKVGGPDSTRFSNTDGHHSPILDQDESDAKCNIAFQKVKACFADGKCSFCDYFKRDDIGPFNCIKTTINDVVPTTHDQAVAYYKKNYAPDALCAPLKENAPFQCTGSEPKSVFEILSLSWSNTELAFTSFGTLFVFILYKCKKAKDPDFLQEDELLGELAKLKADNTAMKKAMEATNEAIKRLEAGKDLRSWTS